MPSVPKRIISLVPSQTELLYDLGLTEEVVGITKFCVHPEEWFRSKTRIGGTKKIDIEKIRALQPDLIIGNKEENEKEQIEMLMQEFPVWMSDIYTLKDSFDMIMRIGTITGKAQEAAILKLMIESEFRNLIAFVSNQKSNISQHTSHSSSLSVAYFIWKGPYMVAGSNTFIDDMLQLCGMKNVFSGTDFMRYPEISMETLKNADPQLILLSSEPYPFKEKHIIDLKGICPDATVRLVDGEMFSWYGSRLLEAPVYFRNLLQTLIENK